MDWFKPLHGKTRPRQFVAFDIEGTGEPDGFICGAIVTEYGREFFLSRAGLWEALLWYGRHGYWLFAHNLEYDLPIVAGNKLHGATILFKSQGLLWATYPVGGRTARFCDSTNLFPSQSVLELGQWVGLPKLAHPPCLLQLINRQLGWVDLSPDEITALRDYCCRDAEIVWHAVAQLQETALSLGGQLQQTIAGVSMDIYRRRFHKWPWPATSPETNRLIRPAFYGGRVENYYVGLIDHCNLYDVNSLYPAVQRDSRFPHPSHVRLDILPNRASDWDRQEGVIAGTVLVPDSLIPPLPYRILGRLFFPFGRLSGLWPIAELRRALAAGCTLVSVDWTLGTTVTFSPFTEFIDTLYRERVLSASDRPGRAKIIKLILNSLYGRFGLNPDNALYKLQPLPADIATGSYRGAVTCELAGQPVMYAPVDNPRQPAYVNVFLAAQISAAGRLRLLDTLLAHGENAIYCDTDSIITRNTLETGSGLGEWRCQMSDGQADLIAPKEYALHNRVLGDRAVVKGVPERVAWEYLKTGTARFERAVRIREALASGLSPATWVETLKERGDVVPKRAAVDADRFLSTGSCQTRAWERAELLRLV